MNLAESHQLLVYAAAFDNRKFDDATVVAWQSVLADIDAASAMEAVRQHFGGSTEYLMPGHVRTGALNIHAAQEKAAAHEAQVARMRAIDGGYHGDQAQTDGHSERSADVAALVGRVAAALPQPDTHQRALSRARRERGRPYAPPTKTKPGHKRKPKDWPEPSSDDVAAMTLRYLRDGYSPTEVAERLYVSKRWCERALRGPVAAS